MTTQWTPKPAALRDLILRMLAKQGAIIDGTGRVPSRIREYYTLPDTGTINNLISDVLGQMENGKLIKRSMNERRTRTYGVELLAELTEADITKLEEDHRAHLTLLIGSPDGSEQSLADLVRLCQRAYRELQSAADRAERRDTSGRVAINVKGALKAIGIAGGTEPRLRYYLKELGLIRSHNKCDDTQAQLWWWTISTEPIDVAKLRSLASGDHSFEAVQERRKRERTGMPEAGPVTVRRIGDETKPPAPQGTESEATVRLAPGTAPKPGPRPTQPAAVAQTLQTVDDPMEALLGIIGKLKAQLTDQQEIHAKELAAKDEEIAELRRQLASRQVTDARVSAIIAEFSNE